jgi:hypothetical protein
LAPTLIASPILIIQLKNQNKTTSEDNYYLLFDNKLFENQKALDQYLENEVSHSLFSANGKSIQFDGQIFNTYPEFTKYLENKFEVNQLLTNKYSSKYLLNAAGELSENILMNDDSRPITVYEGKNGLSYRTRREALDTFKRTYQKKYIFGTKKFDNLETAKDALANSMLKDLENDHTKPV